MYSIWSFFTHRSRFSIIIILAILFLGTQAIFTIPKESNPQVDVPIAIVVTTLPGASAGDVETLVTNVLEEPLINNLSNVKSITSRSGTGSSVITVEFTTHTNIPEAIQSVRDEINKVKKELPNDATEPAITKISFGDVPVVTATVSATIPPKLLQQLGQNAADALKKIPDVSSVTVGGVEPLEVQVLVNRVALAQYNLTIMDVARTIANANISLPAGNISTKTSNFPVRFAGDIKTADTINALPIYTKGGTPIYIRTIARVVSGREKPTTQSRTSIQGKPVQNSISFDIFKRSGSKITTVSASIQKEFKTITAPGGILAGMHIVTQYDNGDKLATDLRTLTKSGIQTMFLVTAVVLLAVGWREALIAAISIPLSFFIAFIGLRYSGNSLNFVSLFALILSIGIIVDSTIVIVEGINTRLKTVHAHEPSETDKDRIAIKMQTALEVVREFHIPLTTGTLTTVAVFVPLFIVSGIVGEFIKSIPFTIIFVLLASILVALGFVPFFATKLLHRGTTGMGKTAQKRDALIAKITQKYKNTLSSLLAYKESQNIFFVTLLLLFAVALALPSMGAIQVVFFGDSNADYMYVQDELPVGSSLAQTSIEIAKAEKILYTIPEIQSFATTLGSTNLFGTTISGSTKNTRFANIFIVLRKDRTRDTIAIQKEIRAQLALIHTSTMSIQQLSDGPPSTAPVLIKIFGTDLVSLDETANIVANTLRNIPGTTNVVASTKNNTSEFVFTIDRAKAASYGVRVGVIATSLRTALYGATATNIRQLGKDIPVIVRVDLTQDANATSFSTNKTDIAILANTGVKTAAGAIVPVSTFIKATLKPSRAVVVHEDGVRLASVSSLLTDSGNAVTITKELKKRIQAQQLPEGVRIAFDGENKDVNKSFSDMFTALILGAVGMFAILVLQFNSFRYALYILAIVPLSLIGVFAGLLITGNPLSFPSIMGFIALSGIVVNNSIILIDTIHTHRRRNTGIKTIKEIVVEASASRLRPVLLTALTTIVGMVPLLFAAAIWVPLAYALMFGLAFATIITLFLVPAIYARWPGKLE